MNGELARESSFFSYILSIQWKCAPAIFISQFRDTKQPRNPLTIFHLWKITSLEKNRLRRWITRLRYSRQRGSVRLTRERVFVCGLCVCAENDRGSRANDVAAGIFFFLFFFGLVYYYRRYVDEPNILTVQNSSNTSQRRFYNKKIFHLFVLVNFIEYSQISVVMTTPVLSSNVLERFCTTGRGLNARVFSRHFFFSSCHTEDGIQTGGNFRRETAELHDLSTSSRSRLSFSPFFISVMASGCFS